MATQEVRITGSVKIEPTRELELMIRRVVADVISNGATPTRSDRTVVLDTIEVAARSELARVRGELRRIVQEMDRHVVVSGSSLSRWRAALHEIVD